MSTGLETYYVVRTNGGTLTVNNSNAVVSHFGTSLKVEITSVAKHSEYGEVSNIEIKSGSVDIVGTAKVNTVIVTGDNVKVDSEVKTIEVKVASTVEKAPEVKVDGETKDISKNIGVLFTRDLITSEEKYFKDGDYLILTSDIKQIYLKNIRNLTVDFNGHNLMYGWDDEYAAIGLENSTLTIKGSGLISKNYHEDGKNYPVIYTTNNSSLTINDVEVEATDTCIYAENSSSVVINSGTFTSKDALVLGTNGSESKGGNKITINGGTFNGYTKTSGYIACGIYAANNDTWNVNGGTFNITNGCGILARSGIVNVSKNVVINLFNDEKNEIQGTVGDSKVMVLSGAALVLDKAANYPGGNPTINNSSSYEIYTLEQYKK